MKNIVKPGLLLFAITAVAALLLGLVFEITKGPIAEQERLARSAAMTEIMPDADTDGFKEVEIPAGASDDVSEVIAAHKGGEIIGYILTVAPKGYAGDIKMMVGIATADSVIKGIKIISHEETVGLGANAAKPEFYEQYNNQPLDLLSVVKVSPKASEIQAITGATITSKSVTDGVNTAIEWYDQNLVNGGAK